MLATINYFYLVILRVIFLKYLNSVYKERLFNKQVQYFCCCSVLPI